MIVKKKQNKNKQYKKEDNIKNTSGRPMPLAPKAGVTRTRRRYKIGGKVDVITKFI